MELSRKSERHRKKRNTENPPCRRLCTSGFISILSSSQIDTVTLVAGEAQFNQGAPDPHLARDGAKRSDTSSEYKTSTLAVISPTWPA